MTLAADQLPVKNPVSPPKNNPPRPKKKYVAQSPHLVGLRYCVISGMVSVHNINNYTKPKRGRWHNMGMTHQPARPQRGL